MSRSQSQNPSATSGGRYVPRTQRLSRSSHSARFSMSNMDENRKSAVADAGPGVPVFPLPFFQKAFLPESNATADQMQSIIADVKASSVWSATDSKWAAYVKPPTEHVGVETVVFSELSTVMGQIATSAAKVLSASESGGSSKTTLSEFSMRPETSVWAEVFNSSYKPDANFILNKSRGYEGETPANATAPLVYDLVDLQEFKKGDNKKDFNNNVAKLLGNASNLFFADPSRRFIFGVTIENVNTRLWFFSRSHIAVSESFDFISNPEALIHYAVSLAYAKSTAELGFDPTVKRVLGEDKRAQYQYTIGGRTYQTFEVLSNFRAAAIVSRATRVYKAKCVEGEGKNDGKVYAIKDVWTGIDAKTEKEIQDDIFGKVNKVNPVEGLSEEEKEYRKYFMKIRDCEVVQTAESQARNYTSEVFLHGQEFPLTGRLPDLQLQFDLTAGSTNVTRSKHTSEEVYRPTGAPRFTGSSLKDSGQDRGTSMPIQGSARRYEMKKQVRVVFEDVGVPLAKLMLEDQPTFFTALADATKGLLYLYSAGYLHRDISDGNILFCDGVGKISDLEYAIECHSDIDGSENAAKSGTPAYMSIEVGRGNNQFLPTNETGEARDVQDSDGDWEDGEEDTVPELPDSTPSRPLFIQHYLNDVESLWWVAVFSQTSTVPTEEYDERRKANEQTPTSSIENTFHSQLTRHEGLFDTQIDRLPFLIKLVEFETIVSAMPHTTQKTTFKALRGAREDLVNFYMAFEKTFTIGPKTPFIYEHMGRWMRRAAKVAPKRVTALKMVHTGTKRKTTHTKAKEDSQRMSKKRKTE